MNVAICEYGAGNVRSVELALRRLGTEIIDDVGAADVAVLPGVGSAAAALAGLRARGHDVALRDRFATGRPILGICLGLQLALEWTEEDGGVEGLGLLPGRVTYVIDRAGTVRHVFNSMVNIGQHINDALNVVRELQAEHSA